MFTVLAPVNWTQPDSLRLMVALESENSQKSMMPIHFVPVCCQCPRLFYSWPLSGFFVLFTMASQLRGHGGLLSLSSHSILVQ
jgi:hypothetical protein